MLVMKIHRGIQVLLLNEPNSSTCESLVTITPDTDYDGISNIGFRVVDWSLRHEFNVRTGPRAGMASTDGLFVPGLLLLLRVVYNDGD